ncbi:MAG: hypothetical protein GVY18_03190, partial [Bacteroidetes bacterium]|nr:hypothetical protein [Bacteroidota bacterium]
MPESSIDAFIEKWRASGASEQSNYALFLTELCDVLAVGRPDAASSIVEKNAYTFERSVQYGPEEDGTRGRIDLYKRGC